MHCTLGVQQVVNVRTRAALIDLTAVYYALEVLLVTVQSESFDVAVECPSVLGVLLGEVIFVMSNRVSRLIANQDLHQFVVKFVLPNRLLRKSASILELLRILHFQGAVLVHIRVIILYIDIAVIVHVEQRFVRVRVLGLLLVVRLPDLALDSAQLLLVPAAEVIAAVAVVLVVVVRRLQDRVVLCLHVAGVVHGDILVESVVAVVVLVRNLVLADRASGRDVPTCCCVLDQSGLPKLGSETAPLDGARLASRLLDLSFHKIALLRFDIRRSRRLNEFEEASLAIAGDPVVQHWGTDVTVSR